MGADFVATGHYVRREMGPYGAELHAGKDLNRDQSYFLFATTQEQLDYLRFPVGGLSKDETRAIAQRMNLATADKPDSQDICFVPDGDYASIVKKLRPEAAEPGEIVHLDGTVLGKHDGIIHFTVGQRKGLVGGSPEPLYVVRLNPRKKQVIVGPRSALGRDRFFVNDVTWLGEKAMNEAGEKVQVRVRSSQPRMEGTAFPRADGWVEILLDTPYQGISPGQACVFYRDSRLLGGGWIQRDEAAPTLVNSAQTQPLTAFT
jgi:tRNA-specific 2-thiouridylase